MRLKDKVAIITGAGRGIGRDIALAYAREGAHVIINDVDPATAATTAEEAAGLGSKSLAVVADVAKSADINRLGRHGDEGARTHRHSGQQRDESGAGQTGSAAGRGVGHHNEYRIERRLPRPARLARNI